MRFNRTWLGVAVLSLVTLTSQGAHTQARLLLADDTAPPGHTVLAGIHLHMDPGWHTYWQNPGPLGIPTRVDWDLPAGVTPLRIQWPLPEKLPDKEFTTYIYSNEVVLLVPLKLAANLPTGPLALKAKVSWLECNESCIPCDTTVQATLNVGPQAKPSSAAPLLETWQKRVPQIDPALSRQAAWEKPPSGDTRPFILEWNSPPGRG